jgi:hypothetical protein
MMAIRLIGVPVGRIRMNARPSRTVVMAAVRVCLLHKLSITLFVELRQFFNEGRHAHDFFPFVIAAERRHPRHFEAVVDDPEDLLPALLLGRGRKQRWFRVQPSGFCNIGVNYLIKLYG